MNEPRLLAIFPACPVNEAMLTRSARHWTGGSWSCLPHGWPKVGVDGRAPGTRNRRPPVEPSGMDTGWSRSRRIAFFAVVILVVVLSFALVSCDTGSGLSNASTIPASGTSSTAAVDGFLETTTTAAASSTTLPSSTTLRSSTSSAVGESGGVTTWPTLPEAKVVRHGPTDKKRIALTFDDNYEKPTAFATLKVLEEYRVPATFFVIGHYVDTGPELARAIAKGGFEVGDHTRSHADCTKLSKRGLRIEMAATGPGHYHELTGARTVPRSAHPVGSSIRRRWRSRVGRASDT